MGNRTTVRFLLLGAFFVLFVLVAPGRPLLAEDGAETLFVEVREAIARGAARPWAPPVERLAFGTPVRVLRREPGWVVTMLAKGVEAFISESALTKKQVVLKAQVGQVNEPTLSGEDVVLAGKGFSETIEGAFKTDELKPQYAMLDNLEAQVIPADELAAFLKAGGLVPKVERVGGTTP